MTDSRVRRLMAALFDDFRCAIQQLRERACLNTSGALVVLLLLTSFAEASTCPLTLVSGEADRNAIVLTLRNAGKLTIQGGRSQTSAFSRMPASQRHLTRKTMWLHLPQHLFSFSTFPNFLLTAEFLYFPPTFWI